METIRKRWRKWTKEEESYILKNYKTSTVNEIAAYLDRSLSSTHNKIYSLTSVRKRKWTKEEEKFLLDNYDKMTYIRLSKKLNKSESSITKKLQRYGIYKGKDTQWTKEDDEYLENNWGIKSIKVLAVYLGRSENAVKRRGYDKGFGGMYADNVHMTINEIKDLLNVDRSVIEGWIKNKGLKHYSKKFYKKKTIFINPKDLYKFLKDNQNLWNATKLEYLALGVEEDWLIEKRKLDNDLVKLKNNTYWTRSEEERLIALSIEGASPTDIAKELNRTKHSVLGKRKLLRKENRL